MKHSKYHHNLGATAACNNRMVEAAKGVGQKSRKGVTKDCFPFDSWFSSKKVGESATEVGAKLIGMVKRNTKGFFKKTI